MIVFTGSMELVIQPMWHDKVSFFYPISLRIIIRFLIMDVSAVWAQYCHQYDSVGFCL
jgi:hypothetical protein